MSMRHEAFFSGDNPYDVLVRGNVLLHREAAILLAAAARPIMAACVDRPLRVLDLACGPAPMIPYAAFERLPGARVAYYGVDINPEVVEAARRFLPPEAIASAQVVEGDAWDPPIGADERPFDLVFVGLNWHHGVPEELRHLGRRVRSLLAPHGILVNHDCYRPDGEPYQRRPREAEPDPRLVECPAWRRDLIDRLARGHEAHGGSAPGRSVLVDHSLIRDFPMSVAEVRAILEAEGFEVTARRYDLGEPLAPYLAFVEARPR